MMRWGRGDLGFRHTASKKWSFPYWKMEDEVLRLMHLVVDLHETSQKPGSPYLQKTSWTLWMMDMKLEPWQHELLRDFSSISSWRNEMEDGLGNRSWSRRWGARHLVLQRNWWWSHWWWRRPSGRSPADGMKPFISVSARMEAAGVSRRRCRRSCCCCWWRSAPAWCTGSAASSAGGKQRHGQRTPRALQII